MSRIDEVRAAMVKAMKAGEKEKKETLSLLLAALKNKAINKREDLTEEEENSVVLKEIKQLNETISLTPPDRNDILEQCKFRISVMEAYAPKMMGEEEVRAILHKVLAELDIEEPAPKDKGKIMKELMPRVRGKADSKLVNQILAEMME